MEPGTSSTKKALRVLLLTDSDADSQLIAHELRRSGITFMTGRVDSAEAFTAALQSFAPDVVLSDPSLAQLDSLAALKILRDVRPTAPFIIVTAALANAQYGAAIRAGADDILFKTSLTDLEVSITKALEVRGPLQKLTERQLEVFRLIAEGNRTRTIATRLGLSEKTVESHRGELMKRLGIHDVARLVRYAVRVGLVPVTFDRPRGAPASA